MIRKISSFLFILLVLSCSSDSEEDNNSNNNNNLLVYRVISDDLENSSYSYEDIFNYDGNKIVSAESRTYNNGNLSSTNYTNWYYTNDKISLINFVDSNSNIDAYYEFDYDSQGRAIEARYFSCFNGDCENEETNTLTYNSNGSVSMAYTYSGTEEEYSTINFDNDYNQISGITSTDDGSFSFTAEYDNKNHAFKNVTGINNLGIFSSSISGVGYYYGYYGLNNNPTKIVEQDEYNGQQDTWTINITYDYNDDNYPRNIITEDVGFGTETIVIEYY